MPILETEGLTVGYRSVDREIVRAVDDVSFAVEKGETVGIVDCAHDLPIDAPIADSQPFRLQDRHLS